MHKNIKKGETMKLLELSKFCTCYVELNGMISNRKMEHDETFYKNSLFNEQFSSRDDIVDLAFIHWIT